MAFPQPPWTQAPSEVMAWRSSVGGRPSAEPRIHRPARVKGFEDRLPVSEEPRLLAHLARLGLGQVKDGLVHLPHLITRLAHRGLPELFRGKLGGTRIEVRLWKGARIEVRATFVPQVSFRKASRIVERLGLSASQGTWL